MSPSLADSLDEEMQQQSIIVFEYSFPGNIQAVYCNFGHPLITLSNKIHKTYARNAVIAHELGHHYTCPGDLRGASPPVRKKSEILAGRWALQRIMPPEKLVAAYRAGVRSPDELCDYLEISLDAIASGLNSYRQIYGQALHLDAFTITFEPFNIYPSGH